MININVNTLNFVQIFKEDISSIELKDGLTATIFLYVLIVLTGVYTGVDKFSM
jgi:hypothetical protein